MEITLKSLLLAILETSADRENSLAESISNTDLFTSKVGIDSISLGVSSSEIDKSESSSIFTDINKSWNLYSRLNGNELISNLG